MVSIKRWNIPLSFDVQKVSPVATLGPPEIWQDHTMSRTVTYEMWIFSEIEYICPPLSTTYTCFFSPIALTSVTSICVVGWSPWCDWSSLGGTTGLVSLSLFPCSSLLWMCSCNVQCFLVSDVQTNVWKPRQGCIQEKGLCKICECVLIIYAIVYLRQYIIGTCYIEAADYLFY